MIFLLEKCVLKVRGTKATDACQDDQIHAALKAVIDGTVHGVQDIWYANLSSENWGFPLVDAKSLSTRPIALGQFGKFAIYGRPELLLFLIYIVTGCSLSYKTGMGRSVL